MVSFQKLTIFNIKTTDINNFEIKGFKSKEFKIKYV